MASASKRTGLQNSDRIQRRWKGYIAPPGGQAHPIGGFYAELLKRPDPPIQPVQPPPEPEPAPPVPPLPAETPAKPQKEQALEKARLIFGSESALEERKQEILNASQNIAGVLVPPKPEEPDNCCMSGCVNCVWEMYRDEMEEWAEKNAQARAALAARLEQGKGTGSMVMEGQPSHVAVSMDDDGGGSETNWESGDRGGEKLFDDIPVGIREFMRTEKKLKEAQRRSQEAAM